MAHLCLSCAWNRTEGIGVDVHVHRISNLLGWVNTKTPEQTRLKLESWLPRKYWKEINHLFVGYIRFIKQFRINYFLVLDKLYVYHVKENVQNVLLVF